MKKWMGNTWAFWLAMILVVGSVAVSVTAWVTIVSSVPSFLFNLLFVAPSLAVWIIGTAALLCFCLFDAVDRIMDALIDHEIRKMKDAMGKGNAGVLDQDGSRNGKPAGDS